MTFSYLTQQLKSHSIVVTPHQQQQLQAYIDLLQKWNKAYNLMSDAATHHIIDRHIIDSLLVLPYLQGQRIIDVGTGAGLPGIPLAILCPEKNFTLLDSNGKKTRFITQVKINLNLSNITIENKRANTYHPIPLFDIVLSRAFASLSHMLEVTAHLCAPSGIFVALKGDKVNSEINALPSFFHCTVCERLPYQDPSIHRHIIVINMIGA